MAFFSLAAASVAAAAGFFGVAVAAGGGGGVPAAGCWACAGHALAASAAAVPRTRTETRDVGAGVMEFPSGVNNVGRRHGGEHRELLVGELALRHRVLRAVEIRRADIKA